MAKELKPLMATQRMPKYVGEEYDAEEVSQAASALIDHLRRVASNGQVSQSELARKLNIKQPSVWEFLQGGGLRGEVLAGLLLLFGYQIVPKED